MALLFRLFIFIILLISSPMIITAKEIKYNHNSITIPELKKKEDLTILTPKYVPDDWTLEIKTTPWISLHYMDSKDTKMMFGISLRKGFRLFDDDFPHAEKVDINGNKGYFSKWVDSGKVDKYGETISGGLLNWVQDGTYVEMNSSRLTKEKMLKIARTMK